MMRLSAAMVASILLAGCAPAYGPGPYYGGGAYVVGEPIAYDGFYDNYYGPFYDGYGRATASSIPARRAWPLRPR